MTISRHIKVLFMIDTLNFVLLAFIMLTSIKIDLIF